MAILEELMESILEGDEVKAKALVEKALRSNTPAKEILNDGLIGAMNIVGVKFKDGEFFVPDVLMAAKAMKSGMELLRPMIEKSGLQPVGTAVIGTVKGDLHDIGKTLVAMMVEGNGFKVVDLGVDVSPEKFVEAAKANNADLCMMSALLTTTMPVMKNTIEALKEAGLGGKVKTMIGGVSVTQDFANKVGADGFGSNATAAVKVAKALMERRS